MNTRLYSFTLASVLILSFHSAQAAPELACTLTGDDFQATAVARPVLIREQCNIILGCVPEHYEFMVVSGSATPNSPKLVINSREAKDFERDRLNPNGPYVRINVFAQFSAEQEAIHDQVCDRSQGRRTDEQIAACDQLDEVSNFHIKRAAESFFSTPPTNLNTHWPVMIGVPGAIRRVDARLDCVYRD